MPIKIPNGLPAAATLLSENIFTIDETRAVSQDIRPLRILLLNLMPTKIVTETQMSRLLGNTPLQVELELLKTATHQSKNTSAEHMLAFYKTFDQVCHQNFDGMVITGAPLEHLEFEDVDYWEELCHIMEWSETHVTSTLHICWGAQAGLYYHYGVPKHPLPQKMTGIFPHRVCHTSPILFRGVDDRFMVPHSRYTTTLREDLEKVEGLKILADSEESGVYAVMTEGGRQVFITGHPEYDGNTLAEEYKRDVATQGANAPLPINYFPKNDPSMPPIVTWRGSANLLYSNWLNYFVYQNTPYDIQTINEKSEA